MKSVLSIKAWFVIFICLFLTVFVMGSDFFLKGDNASEFYNINRLSIKKENPSIFMVGTSLIRCGFYYDDELELELNGKGLNYDFFRFAKSGFDPLPFSEIIDEVLAFKPNVIFLHADYFIDYSGTDSQLYSVVSDYLNQYRQLIISIKELFLDELFYQETVQETVQEKENYPSSGSCGIKQKKIDIDRKLKKTYSDWYPRLKNYGEIPYLYDFVEDLKAQGTKVIFIEMGRSKLANRYLGKQKLEALSQSLEELKNETGVSYWRFPANLDEEYYWDFSHLNSKGREISTNWFIDQLSQHIQLND
ncbi:hypothetical protein [Marinomonas mediterranea]|uniref:SGNH hydrolase-type esterase domain-containing protein n=1 Tax=Marinomonas mediterranea (strain ATCC 700492 / JCM 21426 / NBRC 103028 / MMB-1) TaxID=717774 RepID=F2JXQ2_MARM1|nr:hypothetical protein [Marinomonas mediterranea]ADZ93050.1 hypothetical protein Marme_3840 [Marinomonas mediterranea MMB-1]WCN19064.1 hypothetical protein GV053_19455 [Marinomonas mediterranea MMB-1]